MKPHTLHRLYKAIMFVALTGIVIFVYRTNPDFLKAPKAESAPAQNVSGFAWSGGADSNPGIGWISFNDTNETLPSATYGVHVDTGTGNFSGTAWSEHIGWISFDRIVTKNPPFAPYNTGAPTDPIAKVDTSTGVVTGWARAIAGCEMTAGTPVSDCTASGTAAGNAAGGWDGWIKLSGVATDSSPYGVSIGNDGLFSGYAWGGDILGWVHFAPVTAGADIVHVAFPSCTIANVTSWGSCAEQSGFCSSNPPGTDIPGTRTGTCGFGYTGTAVQACDPGTYCALPAAVNGNGICEPGESLLNAPSDCKGRVQQF